MVVLSHSRDQLPQLREGADAGGQQGLRGGKGVRDGERQTWNSQIQCEISRYHTELVPVWGCITMLLGAGAALKYRPLNSSVSVLLKLI